MGRALKLLIQVLFCLGVIGFVLLFLFGTGLQRVALFLLVIVPTALIGAGFPVRFLWQLTMRRSDSLKTENRKPITDNR